MAWDIRKRTGECPAMTGREWSDVGAERQDRRVAESEWLRPTPTAWHAGDDCRQSVKLSWNVEIDYVEGPP